MKKIKHLLLDLDGTLTDPKEGITKSIQYALACMCAPIPSMDELEWCIGPPLIDSFHILLDTEDRAMVNRAIDFYRERYVDRCTIENLPYEGIHDTLARLKGANLQLYLATSKPWAYASKILEYFNLKEYFTAVHGSELDGTRDYKKDLIAYVMQTHQLPPHQTIMIGDRAHDVVGAKHNKVKCIGVTYGYGSREELQKAGADIICNHHKEVRYLFIDG
ncbi:MAG: HAD family hydrolase [Gammaproteobacteria bacterium RIFCSPHIGHO2_12_FULL_41_15]|nr:MAG: HAD family hydrolase [Gammaproteobacteria bacterium RIFCSPHIGHO2_12_FULL_41_15]